MGVGHGRAGDLRGGVLIVNDWDRSIDTNKNDKAEIQDDLLGHPKIDQ